MTEESLFTEAVGISDPVVRSRFVAQSCGQDEHLQAQVEALLRLHDGAGSFLEQPPLETAFHFTRPLDGDTRNESSTADRLWLNLLGPSDEPGAIGRMGQYDILSLVGRGGMGVVYRARQRNLRRVVALKMIRDPAFGTPDAQRRLRNEAEAAARLQHKNIVRIHEFGDFEGLHYFSMEFVDGQTLEQVAGGKAISPTRAAQYAEAIAGAIHYAHCQGVLHRDLKPANVLIDTHDCVRITDFGLAKQMDDNGTVTETGQILGTARYMSPEQARACHSDIGPATDVYAIGAILYELLTGRAPFQGDTPWETLRRVCEQEPVSPRQVDGAIPRDLESICLRCLQKDVRQRYQSADQLARDLRRFLNGQPVQARPISPLHRAGRWVYRHRTIVFLSACVSILMAVVLLQNGSPRSKEPQSVVRGSPDPARDIDRRSPEPRDLQSGESAGSGDPHTTELAQARAPERVIAQAENAFALPRELDDPLYWLRSFQAPLAEPLPGLTATAIAGEPFGVGSVQIPGPSVPGEPVWVLEKSQRVLYPVQVGGRVRFLFQGTRPLDLTVIAYGRRYRLSVTPASGNLETSLQSWWDDYLRTTHSEVERLSGQDMLRNYLTLMLARRLKLKPKEAPNPWQKYGTGGELEHFAHLWLGTASLRVALQKDTLLQFGPAPAKADRPLPKPVVPPPVKIPAFDAQPVEPLARYVPEECFYVRCGSFADWQWFRESLSTWGGNINNLIAQRGLDRGIQARLEKQLAFGEQTAAGLFQQEAITDFALIGMDTFYLEGAAFGVILQAQDSEAVQVHLERHRRSLARGNPQAREVSIDVRGTPVSFLSTPDNAIRSYHAVTGNVHLITTSRRIVERFLEAAQGKQNLGTLEAFRFARSKFPLARNDKVFIYLSDPFFANVIGPAYRIEMTRRARALADLELVQMARWAAIAEKRPYESVADLVQSGLLPESVEQRPDESRPVLGTGIPTDSLRGAAGTFVPIPDINLTLATTHEVSAYTRFAQEYQRIWTRMDPVIIALNRQPSKEFPQRETLVCDVSIMPLALSQYSGIQAFLPAPTKEALVVPERSLIQISVPFPFQFLGGKPSDFGHIFAGAEDLPRDAPIEIQAGQLRAREPQSDLTLWLMAYLGVSHQAAKLKPLFAPQQLKDLEFQLLDTRGAWVRDLWVRQWNDSIALSRRRDALAHLPEMNTEPAERPAQIRFTIRDLEGTQWGELLRSVLYCQARTISASNPNLLHELMQQLHLEAEEARPLAETLLRGRMTCPLGGEYVTASAPDRPALWVSTAWTKARIADENAVPPQYQAPFARWWHGLSLECSFSSDTLTAHAEFEVDPTAVRVFEHQRQRETTARTELARAVADPADAARRPAFAGWVRRFSDTDLVARARLVLPDLWQSMEDDARTALSEAKDDDAWRRIIADFPLSAAAQDAWTRLGDSTASAVWESLMPTLAGVPDRERLRMIQEFRLRHTGTETSRRILKEFGPEFERATAEDAAAELRRYRDQPSSRLYLYPLDDLIKRFPGTPAAAEAEKLRGELIADAVQKLDAQEAAVRQQALTTLNSTSLTDETIAKRAIVLMLDESDLTSRRTAAYLLNRYPAATRDKALEAVRAALVDPDEAKRQRAVVPAQILGILERDKK